jgi:hypothetical protein
VFPPCVLEIGLQVMGIFRTIYLSRHTYTVLTSFAVGHSAIPRDVACYETTINLPPVSAAAAANGNFCESVFVVEDLTKHPNLCESPYFTGYPSSRYYAGTFITTRSGANIKAYCILHDKPRQGNSQRDLVFMHNTSHTVMTQLETVRALSDYRQNE